MTLPPATPFSLEGALFYTGYYEPVGDAIKYVKTATLINERYNVAKFDANERRVALLPGNKVTIHRLTPQETTAGKIENVRYCLNDTGNIRTELWRIGEIHIPKNKR